MILGFWDPIIHIFERFIVRCFSGLIGLVKLCFDFAEFFYGVFSTLAGASNIFDKTLYGNVTRNIYSIFGIVVLFIMAYNFLMIVIDPDKTSGDMNIEKFLRKLVTTLIIIALLQPIFSLSGAFITSLVEQNSIGRLIFQNQNENAEQSAIQSDDIVNGKKVRNKSVSPINGIMIDVFANLFETVDINSTCKSTNKGRCDNPITQDNFKITLYQPDDRIPSNIKCPKGGSCTLGEVVDYSKENADASYLKIFASNWYFKSEAKNNSNVKTGVTFHFFTGLIVAGYMCYVLILFSFDLAVRVIKIGFYQIVAPLCVACRIMPGGKDEIYKKWKSLTIKTYTSVLVKCLALYLGVWILGLIGTIMSRIKYPDYCDFFCRTVVWMFMIIGILTFIKQMPKIIDELLGTETGLGSTVRDKLKDANSVAKKALGIAGSGAALAKGFGHARKERKDAIKEARRQKREQRREDRKKGISFKQRKTSAEWQAKKDALKNAKKGRLKSLAGATAMGVGAFGRQLSRASGLSDILGDVTSGFKDVKKSTDSAVKDAEMAKNKRDARIQDFKDWMAKRKDLKNAKNASNEAADKLKKAKEDLENETATLKANLQVQNSNIAAQNDKINALKNSKASIDARKKNAEERADAANEEMTALRRSLRSNGKNMTPEAKAQVQNRIDELDTELGSAMADYNAAVRDGNAIDSQLNTAQTELDVMVKTKANLQTQLDEIDAKYDIAGLEAQVKAAVERENILRVECHDANAIVQVMTKIRAEFEGGASTAIERDQKTEKILAEVDSGFLDAYQTMAKKHGKEMSVDVQDAAEKIFGTGTDACNIMNRLADSGDGKTRTKEEFSNILSSIEACRDDGQLKNVLTSYGYTADEVSSINLTQLRGTLQGQMAAFRDKENKNEANKFYESMHAARNGGTVDPNFEKIFTSQSTMSKPEFSEAVAAYKDKAVTYRTYDPKLDISQAENLSKAHDALTTTMKNRETRNASANAANRMKEAKFGSQDKK